MRSPDNEAKITDPFKRVTESDIPSQPGAPEGLLGVKAPASWRQEGDIRDRMTAAGLFRAPVPAPRTK